MRRFAGLVLAAALVAISATGGAADRVERKRAGADDGLMSDAAKDAQRLLLLAPGRPLRVDLLIFIDGKPLLPAWRARLESLLADESWDDGGRIPMARAVRLCESASGEFGVKHNRAEIQAALKELSGKEDLVERTKLAEYVERTFPPFAIAAAPTGSANEDALFGLLDANHDGRLSRDELAQAATRLFARDFDDDHLIRERELIIDPTQEVGGSKGSTAAEVARQNVLDLSDAADPAAIAAAVVKHYDINRDGRLAISGSAPELTGDSESLAKLDVNQDGFLDADELKGLAGQSADVVLPIEFGTAASSRPLSHSVLRSSDELRVRKSLVFGGFRIHLGDARIDIDRNPGDPTQNGAGLRFSRFDADKNGYLDAMECRASPLLSAAFKSMDEDGDGKVTSGEFQVYVDTQSKAAATRVRLLVSDRGHDLFSLLDGNGDGLLTPRELLSAVDLLDTQDHNGDGVLSGNEIPQRWSLKVARDVLPVAESRAARANVRSRQLTASEAGPLWFRKMDRNHDGDLSPSEFPGSAADFAEADTNGDGLIDAGEAEALTKRLGGK